MIKIGMKVKVTYRENVRDMKFNKAIINPFIGTVIDIIKAYDVPGKKKVIKYYGEEIAQPKYGRVFGPLNVDRIIIKKEKTRNKNAYVVLPMRGYARYFIIEKVINCSKCGNIILEEAKDD